MTKRWNGLLVYDKEGSKRNASYIKMHEEAGEKLNMPMVRPPLPYPLAIVIT